MKLPHFSQTRIQIVKAQLDTVWGLMCLLTVPSLVTLAIFWCFEPARGATVKSIYQPMLYAQAGEFTRIVPDVEIYVPSRRLVYQLTLRDSRGQCVHRWPAIMPSDDKAVKFAGLRVRIPATIARGAYQLTAAITYAVNPLKTDNIEIKIASINVSQGQPK